MQQEWPMCGGYFVCEAKQALMHWYALYERVMWVPLSFCSCGVVLNANVLSAHLKVVSYLVPVLVLGYSRTWVVAPALLVHGWSQDSLYFA